MLCFLPLELTFYQINTFFPLLGELVSTSWAISIITLYQMNTFFHFKGTSCFLFLGNYMWPSHQTIIELSYEESLLFQHKSTAPMIYILTFENNLQSGKYFSHFWENRFHLLSNLKITLYQINIFFHFREISCFLFWGNDMWPSHQPIFRALLWRKICSSHINLLLLWYIFLPLEITFEIPLLGKSITLQAYLDFLILSHYL